MFRKPKKKVALRRPVGDGSDRDDAENEPTPVVSTKISHLASFNDDEEEVSVSKPPALLSFDHDEGADVEFTVKKDKKKLKEMKRQQKLELETRKQFDESESRIIKKEEEEESMSERMAAAEEEKRRRNEKQKYLDRYRDSDYKVRPPSDESDSEQTPEDNDTHSKFPSTFSGIPDSRAVYEAKKRREKMRRDGDGYIPLDDDKKIKEKGTRDRLVREDENDDSDEDAGRFYSSKALLETEDERRRAEQNNFLEHEQGDDVCDPEMDEWEKQQIQKAVNKHTIGRIREEYIGTAKLFGGRQVIDLTDDDQSQPMDEDMDIDHPDPTRFKGPTTGGEIKLEDVLDKLKLRLQDRQDALNTRREAKNKIEAHLEENRATIITLELDKPNLANKYTMYQEMRIYTSRLLDCLDEKVREINDIADRRRLSAKLKNSRLVARRRKDIQDQYAECSALAAGKSLNAVRIGEAATRATAREARRMRRRREREIANTSSSHEDGLSSDDEEPTSQQVDDQNILVETSTALEQIFVDAEDDYSQICHVLERLIDWLAVDEKSFMDAFIHLCIPKLLSPFVRIQLIQTEFLKKDDIYFSRCQWFADLLLAGSNNMEISRDHEVLVGLIPNVVEKVIVPFLNDLVNDEWDPLSLHQTKRLGFVLEQLSQFPTLNSQSKPLNALIQRVKHKLLSSVDEDLFTPMFGKQAIENVQTGCRSFLDRQFWTGIKFLRCLSALSRVISPEVHFALAMENVVNKVCVLGIQLGVTNDVTCERKVKALIEELPSVFFNIGGHMSFRSLRNCLKKVADDQETANREFYRELRVFIGKLPGI